ncbi:hypothetical protein SBRY_60429 [Actinacidiphila bryophytorum]|uniref:Uncharacterized protein n=1 Tax=Actinacidiphila bryophytorum TaxID=1436133 RepID=A0A9W4MKA0_9ACTN|nr:hypothetical protein SBRY_60429 [Actinacidiphila bryophytorum]
MPPEEDARDDDSSAGPADRHGGPCLHGSRALACVAHRRALLRAAAAGRAHRGVRPLGGARAAGRRAVRLAVRRDRLAGAGRPARHRRGGHLHPR